MTTKTTSLIKAYYSGSLSRDEFLKQYFSDKNPSEGQVIDLAEQTLRKQDGDSVEELITLLGTEYFNINSFVSPLCQLLEKDWHTRHEDIAMLLLKTKSPNAIDCLYNAAELQFEYLSYDDTYQFARKCIKALAAIDDKRAVDWLKLLAESGTVEISEYAKKELRYKGLL